MQYGGTQYGNVEYGGRFQLPDVGTTDKDIDGVARIQTTDTQTIDGTANIHVPPVSIKNIYGVGSVYGTTTKTVTGIAAINLDISRIITGKSRIKVNNISQTITGVASIDTPETYTKTISGLARITVPTTKTITGRANIYTGTTPFIEVPKPTTEYFWVKRSNPGATTWTKRNKPDRYY